MIDPKKFINIRKNNINFFTGVQTLMSVFAT